MHVKPADGFLSTHVIKGQITPLSADSTDSKPSHRLQSKFNSIAKCFDKKLRSITRVGRSLLPGIVDQSKFKTYNPAERRHHSEIYENEYDTIELKKFSVDRKGTGGDSFSLDTDSTRYHSPRIERDVSGSDLI
jgi:hypothetical protein